jgi:hypothetical protein
MTLTQRYINQSGDDMIGRFTASVTPFDSGWHEAIKGSLLGGDAVGAGVYGYTEGSSAHGVHGGAVGTNGVGVYGETTGASGRGVYGLAENTGDVYNFGGYFEARGTHGTGVEGNAPGTVGCGVFGFASNTGNVYNYGVYGVALGTNGRGVFGVATGTSGLAVYGNASNTGTATNYGGYFEAAGGNSRGVYGRATNDGNFTNYGGYFTAAGSTGRGVFGEAPNYGVHGRAYGSTGQGVFGEATGYDGLGVKGLSFGDSGIGVYSEARGKWGRAFEGKAIGTTGTNHGGYFFAAGPTGRGVMGEASGASGRGIYGYAANTGDVENYGGYFIAEGERGIGVYVEALNSAGWGVLSRGSGYDFYAGGPDPKYGPFTGAHEVRFAEEMPAEIQPGMIVSVTGRAEKRKKDNGEISLSSTLPTVILAAKAMDKAVFGVLVSEAPLLRNHWYESLEGERFGAVNALGEGRMWVTNINGDIEAGDYITSSDIPGYGQLQDDDLLHSYTVGKAIETVDWDSVTETVELNGKMYKVYLIAVVYTSG